MKYNFQLVNPFPVFSCFSCACVLCGERMQSDRAPVWADLNGEAFKAYYCEECKTRLEESCQ